MPILAALLLEAPLYKAGLQFFFSSLSSLSFYETSLEDDFLSTLYSLETNV